MIRPQLAFDSQALNLRDILPGQPIRRETFEVLAGMGYTGIEIHPYAKAFVARWYGKDVRQIVDLAREGGLHVSAYNTRDAHRPQEPTVEEFADSLVPDFEAAKELGTRYVVLHAPAVDVQLAKAMGERTLVSRIAACWKEAALRAGQKGLVLVWSYHEISATDSLYLGFDTILEHVDEPNLGIEFDLATAAIEAAMEADKRTEEGLPTTGVLSQIERYKGIIATIRLSGTNVDMHDQDLDVGLRYSPGRGTLDWSRVVPALLDAWIPSPWWAVEPRNWAEARSVVEFFERNVVPYLPEHRSNNC